MPEHSDRVRDLLSLQDRVKSTGNDETVEFPEIPGEIFHVNRGNIDSVIERVANSYWSPQEDAIMDVIREGFNHLIRIDDIRTKLPSPRYLKILIRGSP